MRAKIIDWIRRALGTKRILDRLECIERELYAARGETAQISNSSLEILPGTEYSRYAIPLEYQPSRVFAPRYGYSHGKIKRSNNGSQHIITSM